MTGLALAFIVLALIDPLGVQQAGFVLSFSAVAGILLLYRPIRALLGKLDRSKRHSWLRQRIVAPAMSSVSVSAAAQLGVTPATIQFFHRLPLWSVVANLFAAPLIALAFPMAIAVFLLLPFLGDSYGPQLSVFIYTAYIFTSTLTVFYLSPIHI